MAMVCPQCGTSYEQRLQCPLCETRLLYHSGRHVDARAGAGSLHWRQRSWGRILIGLVVAQGLFYGLRHLLTAVWMAMQGGEAGEPLGATASGLLLIQAARMAALLAGAVFAGAGQHQGGFVGGMVGAWNGVLSVLLLPAPAQTLTPIAVLGQPLLQAAMGVAGGWLGSSFWKPLPSNNAPEAPPPRPRNFFRRHRNLFAGPVAWLRVALGAAVAVAGTLTATVLFDKILDLGRGTLNTTSELQDRLITLEIKALALLLGGALAGATTSNGLKQGLFVGLVTAVILIGIEMNYVEHWIQVGGLTAIASLSLCLAGSWFGSQLFPPLLKLPRRRGLRGAPL
jgi:hypothetical protein